MVGIAQYNSENRQLSFSQSPSLPGSVGQADPSAWVATHEKKKKRELINLELGNSDFFPSLGGPTTFSGVRKKILTKKSGTVQGWTQFFLPAAPFFPFLLRKKGFVE